MSGWSGVVSRVCEHWTAAASQGQLRPGSAARYGQVFTAFSRFAEVAGAAQPEAVTAELCRQFIAAPSRGGAPPCTATSRLRLTVIRSGFEVLAYHASVGANPTIGMRVHHVASERVPTPLTPVEALRLLLSGRASPRDSLRPATTALALLGAAHAEVAGAVASAFTDEGGTLTLGAGQSARGVAVPPPLVHVFRSRVAHQRATWRRRGQPWIPGDIPLALNRPLASYPLNSVAPTVSNNLSLALRHAGIHRAGVRPKSVREYAANAIYARTQRIESVAEQLGMTSLDTVARLIDSAWQDRWGDTLRARSNHDS